MGIGVKRRRARPGWLCYKGGVKERQEIRITEWRKRDGTRADESLGVRILRRTAIVWVPVVGIGAAVGIKAVGWLVIRMVVEVFKGIVRLFH